MHSMLELSPLADSKALSFIYLSRHHVHPGMPVVLVEESTMAKPAPRMSLVDTMVSITYTRRLMQKYPCGMPRTLQCDIRHQLERATT